MEQTELPEIDTTKKAIRNILEKLFELEANGEIEFVQPDIQRFI